MESMDRHNLLLDGPSACIPSDSVTFHCNWTRYPVRKRLIALYFSGRLRVLDISKRPQFPEILLCIPTRHWIGFLKKPFRHHLVKVALLALARQDDSIIDLYIYWNR